MFQKFISKLPNLRKLISKWKETIMNRVAISKSDRNQSQDQAEPKISEEGKDPGVTQVEETKLVKVEEAKRFMLECLLSQNILEKHASIMASVLIAADSRGTFSHGMNRLDKYITDIADKVCDGNVIPTITACTPATAWVDGHNGLGPVIGTFCMNIAIAMARNVGVGWVCAKGSNHFGISAWYTMMAANQGLVAFAITNSSPYMTPTGGIDAGLGTNPLAFAAPAYRGDSFVLDMSTTTVSAGQIEIARRKRLQIPRGWANDSKGRPTTEPTVALAANSLLPLGGEGHTGGHKGYGLATLVDGLSGVMSGGNYGTNVRSWTEKDANTIEADLGQCYIVVNPNCFAPGFENRMSDLLNQIRNSEPIDPDRPVIVAGDREKEHLKMVECEGGIRYHANQLKSCAKMAKKYGVDPLETIG